jgi:hypothetical protein
MFYIPCSIILPSSKVLACEPIDAEKHLILSMTPENEIVPNAQMLRHHKHACVPLALLPLALLHLALLPLALLPLALLPLALLPLALLPPALPARLYPLPQC